MITFQTVVDAYAETITSTRGGILARLAFWCDRFGDTLVADVTAEAVDQAVLELSSRGKLNGGRRHSCEPSAVDTICDGRAFKRIN